MRAAACGGDDNNGARLQHIFCYDTAPHTSAQHVQHPPRAVASMIWVDAASCDASDDDDGCTHLHIPNPQRS
jgi:hypothetical protein